MHRGRLGLKGPRAADWLATHGISVPSAPNTYIQVQESPSTAAWMVARLGATEFFLEDAADSVQLKRLALSLGEHPLGVYPVIREDWGLQLSGDGLHEILAQVCNVNFSALSLDSHPVVMTLMIGVAVLVVPQHVTAEEGGAVQRQYRIWCDPTFGPYLSESLGTVVIESGGRYMGVSG